MVIRFLMVGIFLLPATAFANLTYVCTHGESERVISVAYQNDDSPLPCEVVYEKDTGTQILWTATSEQGYCEARAADFVEKQRGWGWQCDEVKADQSMNTASSSEGESGQEEAASSDIEASGEEATSGEEEMSSESEAGDQEEAGSE